MDVRNCKKCGRLFQYAGQAVCPACAKELEEKFFEVRKYIYDNPGANMSVVAEETEVPVQQIKRWVREERLSFSKDSGISISCEKCGKSILTGRFCKECKSKMTESLSSAYVEKKPEKSPDNKDKSAKMRFFGN